MRLAKIMVAPNGARLKKKDHPSIPVTLDETLACAKQCFAAGAGALHFHLRDENQDHILDHGLYREAVKMLETALPKMQIQITTEAVGKYEPKFQREVALKSGAKFVSASVRELARDENFIQQAKFYEECDEQSIHLQHIIYDVDDLCLLQRLLPKKHFEKGNLQLLFVLGRYHKNQQSDLEDLTPFLKQLGDYKNTTDWAICAFGKNETKCLAYALSLGGKVRVGFENSIHNADGSIAKDNCERVVEVASSLMSI